MSRINKSMEIEGRFMVTGAGGGVNGECFLIGRGVIWGDKNILKLGSGDGCITL
jgi:hypothetical protein